MRLAITGTGILAAAAAVGAVYLLTRERDGLFRPVTPDVTNAYWNSSLGDITAGLLDWRTNGWGSFGDSWDWTPYSAEEAARAAEVSGNVNDRLGWGSGSLGTL